MFSVFNFHYSANKDRKKLNWHDQGSDCAREKVSDQTGAAEDFDQDFCSCNKRQWDKMVGLQST